MVENQTKRQAVEPLRRTAGIVLTLAASTGFVVLAPAQSIVAEGDVLIDQSAAVGTLAVPLNASQVEVAVRPSGAPDNVLPQGRLALDGGADLITGDLFVADSVGDSYGIVDATGFGTTIEAQFIGVGGAGYGVLRLRDGAVAQSNNQASFGASGFSASPGRGDLDLEGSGSTLRVLSGLDLNIGTGRVADGARVLVDNGVQLGSDQVGYDLWLTGGSQLQVGQTLTVGSNTSNTPTTSQLTLGGGSSATAGMLRVDRGGAVTLEGGQLDTGLVQINPGGALSGYGQIDGSVLLFNSSFDTPARLSVASGQTLRIVPPSFQDIALESEARVENFGTLDLGTGELINGSIAEYIGRHSTLRAGRIDNFGHIDLVEGFNLIDADLDVISPNLPSDARVTVSGSATALFTGDVNNNGQIRVETGSIATFTQNVSGSGTFDGAGQVVFLGGFTPGNSPGLVSFGGDLVLGSSLVSEFEIDGAERGTEYDAVDVAGELQLGGTLRTTLTTGVSAGDVFTLFDAQGGVTGTFDSVDFEGPLPSTLSLEVIYTATQVQLGIIGPQLLGDYNGNGFVDAADYTVWQDNFNSTTNLAADGNGDGVINAADYTVWQDNFGDSLDSVGTLTSIPEPGTLGLTAAGLALLLRRRQI